MAEETMADEMNILEITETCNVLRRVGISMQRKAPPVPEEGGELCRRAIRHLHCGQPGGVPRSGRFAWRVHPDER